MSTVGIVIGVLVVGGFLGGMLLAIPLGVGPPATTSPEDTGFASASTEADYLQSVCPCFQGIPDFATTERVVSNTSFVQGPDENVPDPNGLSTFAWAWGQVTFFIIYIFDNILTTNKKKVY